MRLATYESVLFACAYDFVSQEMIFENPITRFFRQLSAADVLSSAELFCPDFPCTQESVPSMTFAAFPLTPCLASSFERRRLWSAKYSADLVFSHRKRAIASFQLSLLFSTAVLLFSIPFWNLVVSSSSPLVLLQLRVFSGE